MNATISQIATRTIFALACGACLTLLAAKDASAHRVEYRPYTVQVHYVPARTMYFPAWLKRNRNFQHWYSHSRYRFKPRLSWHRLYDIYRVETRYRRHGVRYFDRHDRDHGHRSYYSGPTKHWY